MCIRDSYDRESQTFPKGPEGVCTMVGKKFGEQAEQAARKMVERMAPQQQAPELQELSRIRELAGVQKEASASNDREDKLDDAIAALYGPEIWDNDDMFKLSQDLDAANPSDDDLDYIIANKKLPDHLSNTKFTNNDQIQFGEGDSELDRVRKLSGIGQGMGF